MRASAAHTTSDHHRRATEPLRIAAMKPVGNYAYSIDFSDGHDTGIYTLETLRELGHLVT